MDKISESLSEVDISQHKIERASQLILAELQKTKVTPVEILEEWLIQLNGPDQKKLGLVYVINHTVQNLRSKQGSEAYVQAVIQYLPKGFEKLQDMSESSLALLKKTLDVWKQRSIFSDQLLNELKGIIKKEPEVNVDKNLQQIFVSLVKAENLLKQKNDQKSRAAFIKQLIKTIKILDNRHLQSCIKMQRCNECLQSIYDLKQKP